MKSMKFVFFFFGFWMSGMYFSGFSQVRLGMQLDEVVARKGNVVISYNPELDMLYITEEKDAYIKFYYFDQSYRHVALIYVILDDEFYYYFKRMLDREAEKIDQNIWVLKDGSYFIHSHYKKFDVLMKVEKSFLNKIKEYGGNKTGLFGSF